jgi:hypothetical protein
MSEVQSEVHNDTLSYEATYQQTNLNSMVTTPHRIYKAGTLNQILGIFHS